MNRMISLLVFLLLGLLAFSQAATADFTIVDKDEWKVLMGGFAELDAISDNTRSLTEVAGNNAVERAGNVNGNGDNGRTQFSLRNSRLDFTMLPPVKDMWKTKGYFEIDFLGNQPAVSDASYYTNATPRLRHAYLSADKEGLQFVAGQTWSLFGWQPQFFVTTVSVAPVSGVLYQRNPELLVLKNFEMAESGTVTAAADLERPTQKESRIPNINAGLKYSLGSRRAAFAGANSDIKTQPMTLGVSGTFREYSVPSVDGVLSDNNYYPGTAVAVDGMIPLIASSDEKDVGNTLMLTGEYSTGRGYGDEFPSWSGNLAQTAITNVLTDGTPNMDAGIMGVTPAGRDLVKLTTWNVQFQYHLPVDWSCFATAGFGRLTSSNIATMTPSAGKVSYDRSDSLFLNFFHDFSKQVRIAAEIDSFTTHYSDGLFGRDTRIQLSTWFRI